MGLREKKKQQTRQRLLSVASKLFNRQGFQSTTVEDIVAQAEISRMTFFNYFASKEKLLEALALEWFGQHRSFFEIMIGNEGTSRAAAPPGLEERLDVIINNRKFLKMIVQHTQLFNNFSSQAEPAADSVAEFIESHFQSRLNLVQEAQQKKIIRDDIEASEICHLYDALRNDIAGRWLMDDDASPNVLRERFSAAMRVFLAGLEVPAQN